MNARKIEINCNEGTEVLHDYQPVTSIIINGESLDQKYYIQEQTIAIPIITESRSLNTTIQT
jgi:hypothetical protein